MARTPVEGKDTGIVRVTSTGTVWAKKSEAESSAKKYGGRIRKVPGGWWARATKLKPKPKRSK